MKKNLILSIVLLMLAAISTTAQTNQDDEYDDTIIFEPVTSSLKMRYYSMVFYQGYPILVDYTMQCKLITRNFTGNLSLHFKINNVDTTYVVENVQAESIYYVNLTLQPDYPHNIREATRNTIFLTQAGSSIPVFTPIDIIGKIVSFTEIDVIYAGTSDIVSLNKENIQIYPNPATNFITIRGLQGTETLHCYNLNGELLFSQVTSSESEIISVAHLPSGMYCLKVSNGKVLKWLKK